MITLINRKLSWIILLLVAISAVIPVNAQTRESINLLRTVGRISADATSVSARLPISLSAMLERKIIADPPASVSRTIPVFQRIQAPTLPQIWEYGWNNEKYSGLEEKEGPDMDHLFLQLTNKEIPSIIPIQGISLDPLYEDQSMQTLWKDLPGERRIGPKSLLLGIAACKRIDQLLFVEKDGQVFINVPALKHFHSYGRALEGLALTIHSFAMPPLFTNSVKNFVLSRNQQIATSLTEYLNTTTQDITTQRTAEEIRLLVKNLHPANPLRISVESALRTTATNGYIRPVVEPER